MQEGGPVRGGLPEGQARRRGAALAEDQRQVLLPHVPGALPLRLPAVLRRDREL